MNTSRGYRIIFIIAGIMLMACEHSKSDPGDFSKLVTREGKAKHSQSFGHIKTADCEDFVILLSASKLAKRLEEDRDWVLDNYQVPLRIDTLNRAEGYSGVARPGENCLLISQQGSWFFIQSSINQESGWIHRSFVAGIQKLDPLTQQPCIESR